jgi:flavin reductase (DIM6/NTAB) family NADH-FMN oxidoreductase RutF
MVSTTTTGIATAAGAGATPGPDVPHGADLHRAFGRMAQGDVVVSFRHDDGAPVVLPATTAGALSLDPPLLLATLPRRAGGSKLLQSGRFGVDVAARNGAAPHATFYCQVWNVYDGGDHIILVGEVLRCASSREDPEAP